MKKRVKNKAIKNGSLILMVILGTIMIILLLVMYFRSVDNNIRKLEENRNLIYVSKDNKVNDDGLYVANIKDDLDEFIKDRNSEKVTYKIDGEVFYFELSINRTEEITYNIEKIVDEKFGINARVNLNNIESINYRTGNPKESTVLKVTGPNTKEFFVMIDGIYYFLGKDIESISYMGDQFYYMSYNAKYNAIREASSCSGEIKKSIEKFNKKDYFYKYGKINFLDDYYQKLSSKTYTVEEKCKEFDREEN